MVGWVEDPDTYPISSKRHTFEYLREVAHLRPRTNTFGAVARVRHCLAMAIHRFYHGRGFFWVRIGFFNSPSVPEMHWKCLKKSPPEGRNNIESGAEIAP